MVSEMIFLAETDHAHWRQCFWWNKFLHVLAIFVGHANCDTMTISAILFSILTIGFGEDIFNFRYRNINWPCLLTAMFLTLYLQVLSADNLCKQFGPRSGQTERLARYGSNLFDTQMVFQKEFFEKVNFEKNQQTTKNTKNFPGKI